MSLLPKRAHLRSEAPLDVGVTAGGCGSAQSSEEVVGEINGLTHAGATLVDQFAGDAVAVQGDLGHATAVGVAVGLGAHHVWKKKTLIRRCLLKDG